MISAKIIADSICQEGRITTLQLEYPRFIHAEFMTHRAFSRNASSSRAEPIEKHIARIQENPAMPIYWGSNKPGMQPGDQVDVEKAKLAWNSAKNSAINHAIVLKDLGLHKQIVNRVLEPFSHINVIVTATEWDNFFELRIHKDAQQEICELAKCIQRAMNESTPQKLIIGEWHLPYLSSIEVESYKVDTARKLSVARCARVSYLKHDGQTPSLEEDIKLYDRLIKQYPVHASPTEHQATPTPGQVVKNLVGWSSFRNKLGF